MVLRRYRYKRLLDLANKSQEANLHAKTIHLLLKADEVVKGNPSLYAHLAYCYTKLSQFAEARNYLSLARKIDPKNVDYEIQEIHLRIAEGSAEIALSKIDRLPLHVQAQSQVLENKAWALYQLGRTREAKQIYQALLEQNPTSSHYLLCISDCYKKLGDSSKSLEYTSLAVDNDGSNAMALNNLGYKLIYLGEYDRAIELLKNAIKMDPQHAFAYNNLGLAFLKTGELTRAYKSISKSLELDPNNSYAYKNVALCFIEENKTSLAIQNLLRARELGYKKLYGSEVDDLLARLEN